MEFLDKNGTFKWLSIYLFSQALGNAQLQLLSREVWLVSTASFLGSA